MAKGILGIEEIPAATSALPDTVPAVEAKVYANPRHDAIAIVPRFDEPIFGEDGSVRVPVRVSDTISMGRWVGPAFELSPNPKRFYQEQDFLTAERIAKYPGLEGAIKLILEVIEKEAQEAGII